MTNTQKALSWITTIIKKHNIPFQIADGLAAQAYGSTRRLNDIDIDMPEEHFEKIKEDVTPFITCGPKYYKDEHWDLYLMSLSYYGHEIDISGTNSTKIYNQKNKTWEKIITDFSKVNHIKIYGLILPTIRREELMAYKKVLARPVDLLDVEYLKHDC